MHRGPFHTQHKLIFKIARDLENIPGKLPQNRTLDFSSLEACQAKHVHPFSEIRERLIAYGAGQSSEFATVCDVLQFFGYAHEELWLIAAELRVCTSWSRAAMTFKKLARIRPGSIPLVGC